MHASILIGLLLVCMIDGKPVRHSKRYDTDYNDAPDKYYIDEATANFMLQNSLWTSFPVTSSIVCPLTGLTTSLTMHTLSPISTATFGITTNTTTTTPVVAASSISLLSPLNTASPTERLPSPADFEADKGTEWQIELLGNLRYTGALGSKKINADKGRTGKIGDKIVWNFGDMQCADDWRVCGLSMGSAFYGTKSIMTVNTSDVDLVQNNDFLQAWSGDTLPQSPQLA